MASLKGLLAVLLIAVASAATPSKDCPFKPGSCPVTLDNVVNVFYHDTIDRVSCQEHCKNVPECNFFTMFSRSQGASKHMKCFLFKTCDELEPCTDCISGPKTPAIDLTECEYDGPHTCDASLDNLIEVFYFDSADSFSCQYHCDLLPECKFWTEWKVNKKEEAEKRNKCFLYKQCDTPVPCHDCTTGPTKS